MIVVKPQTRLQLFNSHLFNQGTHEIMCIMILLCWFMWIKTYAEETSFLVMCNACMQGTLQRWWSRQWGVLTDVVASSKEGKIKKCLHVRHLHLDAVTHMQLTHKGGNERGPFCGLPQKIGVPLQWGGRWRDRVVHRQKQHFPCESHATNT